MARRMGSRGFFKPGDVLRIYERMQRRMGEKRNGGMCHHALCRHDGYADFRI